MEKEMIPPETEGKNTNLENSVVLNSKEEAMYTFKRACNRMLNPVIWHKLCGPASAEFMLAASNGEEENRLAREGDYFRIDIPGPGPSAGNGYDWVRVELIEDYANPGLDTESCGMKLRASAQPGRDEYDTAHFFRKEATSSFIICRKGNTVVASYHGRNEVPNTSTNKTTDNLRNVIISMGAFAGLSEMQWSVLIKSFLEKETVV